MEMAGKVCFFGKNSLEMSKQFGCKLHPNRTMYALRSRGFLDAHHHGGNVGERIYCQIFDDIGNQCHLLGIKNLYS